MTKYFKENLYVANWTHLKVTTDEIFDIKNKQQDKWEKQDKGYKRQCENENEIV